MAVRGINKVILWRWERPEVRYIPTGAQWQTCRWPRQKAGVTNRRGNREQTEWHRVVLFGKLAEVAGEYLHKGEQVYIEGQLRPVAGR
ncbi:single-stranded DNA-binding protein [Escherichia coli]|uniref:single-stranded DNA-binding protein n=1 Tax=Escherichia coli TaxID=562 RepID=UPI0008FBE0D7|nr:single-stranded DNA-binding protein [Escherichia coli]